MENKNIKLYNKDCLEIFKKIPDESIDLVIIDPPYQITKRGNSGTTGGMLKNKLSMDGKIFIHNDIKPEQYIPEIYRVLKDGTHFYIMSNHINLQKILNSCISEGFKFIKSLIWNKGNKIMGGYYMSQFEYILFFRKGKAKRINNCGTSDVLEIPNKKTKDKNGKNIHDTEKPISLMKILVENSSNENDVVLDCFMGVGGVGIACVDTNRKFIGIEIDENYFSIAKNRIENNINLINNGNNGVKL